MTRSPIELFWTAKNYYTNILEKRENGGVCMRTKFSHRDARHYLKYGIILFFFTKMPPKLNQNGLWEYRFPEFWATKYKCVKKSGL